MVELDLTREELDVLAELAEGNLATHEARTSAFIAACRGEETPTLDRIVRTMQDEERAARILFHKIRSHISD